MVEHDGEEQSCELCEEYYKPIRKRMALILRRPNNLNLGLALGRIPTYRDKPLIEGSKETMSIHTSPYLILSHSDITTETNGEGRTVIVPERYCISLVIPQDIADSTTRKEVIKTLVIQDYKEGQVTTELKEYDNEGKVETVKMKSRTPTLSEVQTFFTYLNNFV